ncbi:MAG: ribosome silencing factor [Flavobacteriales bacterium]|nr:ribosome silencing factor [Flavobacteriales bacterium]|tara:strand:+ start:1041 stop:1418 length:378 start_codon:yes stop_codon:yes gene_type:complete
MGKKIKQLKSDDLTDIIVEGIKEKKGEKIVKLDLKGLDGAITDYFVICEANSSTQIDAIKDSIEDVVRKECGEKPWHVEGTTNSEWVLLDYVNVVAHIFNRETRPHFDLEGLWADAKVTEISADY